MTPYRLVTYECAAAPRAGLWMEDCVVDIALGLGRLDFETTQGILSAWTEAIPLLDQLAVDSKAPRVRAESVRLLAPVPVPLEIYCMGANYQEHVDNMARATGSVSEADPRSRGMPPWHFLKSGHCVVATETDVPLESEKLDWEAELVAVIGRKVRNASLHEASDAIAGYTIANDLSARDRIRRKHSSPDSPFAFDFVSQKSFDGSCPLGPYLVPAKFVPAPESLRIQLWVNQQPRIDSSTSQMIYSTAEQIVHLSSFVTLYPGDLILTGTPAGTGAETGEFLKKGDVVRISIESLGTLRNRIV